MVSNAKRSRYTSDTTSDEDMDYHPGTENKPARKPTRTPKCFSKNALMARENRLKKKMYITNLEDQVSSLNLENKKLSALVDNQSQIISDLRREVRYLKSVISNSDGLGNLIRNINTNTGMAVTTSLDKRLGLSAQHPQQVPRKNAHPWEEPDQKYPDIPTPESLNSYYSSPDFEDTFLNDIDLSLDMNDNDLLDMIDERTLETPLVPTGDHSYTNLIKNESTSETPEPVGVCLHVSNNKVSLEFCPSCSQSATQAWKQT
ncbi:uncharacterized protein LOC132702007 [Cylas formicarius]|uniref:uncharacterized protein LOC132702007 n=1 Tax=Cylas formicarius TaxID=197179 RepID=UPI002958B2A0|nr:uncharacterized protein LOC132702007 [Cylas formicarius]